MRPEASQVGQNQRPRGTLNNEGTKQSMWYPKSQPEKKSKIEKYHSSIKGLWVQLYLSILKKYDCTQ